MQKNIYHTILRPSEGLYKEKGSKFIAHAFPIEKDAHIDELLKESRKTYHDARHHCYGYILGMEDVVARANDDGEPSHSAGDPILGQIRSFGLVNVLVIVVRYFGGTKLGVSGLIHAYKTAAEEALKNAKKIEVFPKTFFTLHFEYDDTAQVERVLNQFEVRWKDRAYIERCEFSGVIHQSDYVLLREKLLDLRRESIAIQH